jgi:hypothetical protein
MYFSIHYENGASSFQYEIQTPCTDIKAVMTGLESFLETTMEQFEEPDYEEQTDILP